MGNTVATEAGTTASDLAATTNGIAQQKNPPLRANSIVGRSPVTDKETDSGSTVDKINNCVIDYAASSMQGWRLTMEDCHTLCKEINIDISGTSNNQSNKTKSSLSKKVVTLQNHSLYAVYDGHGGGFSSKYAGENFIRIFQQRTEMKRYAQMPIRNTKAVPKDSNNKAANKAGSRSDVNGIELLKSALMNTFYDIDEEIRVKQNSINYIRKNSESDINNSLSNDNDMLIQYNSNATQQNQLTTLIPTGASSQQQQQQQQLVKPAMRMERSGSTIVVVLITPTHIICANSGDSRAILKTGGRVLPLSFDHKPSNLPEQERIYQAPGGFVKNKRINGDLAVSRGLGDFAYKGAIISTCTSHEYEGESPNSSNRRKGGGDNVPSSQQEESNNNSNDDDAAKKRKQRVTVKPDIIVYPRRIKKDEFIVLACDGVWDVATNEVCAKIIQDLFDEGETNLSLICEEVLDLCLERRSRDNMTIVVLTFGDGVIMNGKTSPFNMSNVVWSRRTARKASEMEKSAKYAIESISANLGITAAPSSSTSTNKNMTSTKIPTNGKKVVPLPS